MTGICCSYKASTPVVSTSLHARQFDRSVITKRQAGVICALLLSMSLAEVKAAAFAEGRGEMLYQNHCIACHTAQVHWREQRLAKDWASLRVQVRRWERNTGLTWSDEDIEAVSQYLNQLYYQFPDPPKDKAFSMLNQQRRTEKGQGPAVLSQSFLHGD